MKTRPDDLMLGVALGTFHVAVLTLVLILPLFATGALKDLLDGLSTLVGGAIFAVLWAATCFCTYRGLREFGLQPGRAPRAGAVFGSAISWGAVNGAAFVYIIFTGALIVVFVSESARGDPQRILDILIVSPLLYLAGGFAAAVVGGVIGMAFALLDLTLLALARSLNGADAALPA